MNHPARSHAFISYVRDDRPAVERLCSELKGHGIESWIDRDKIHPGERWQVAIRRAIEQGAFFVAYFSGAYVNRETSYMNVELSIAIDQLRSRPADRAWFIPVLLQGGSVPDRPIGGGETLRDIQWVDLTADWVDGVRRIVNVLRPGVSAPVTTSARPQPERLVIMRADLVGASSVALHFGVDELSRLLSQTAAILSRAADDHHGFDVTMFFGEGMLAAFGSASEAVSCALAIEAGMHASHDLRELKMRIGLTAGSVLRHDRSVVGMPVNLASRVCSLAEGGQILITESVRLLGLGVGVEVSALGPVPIKGFPERVRLYEVWAR